MSRAAIDITGARFGMLTVIERAVADSNGYARWRCACDCGGETIVISQSLRRGATQSCGCLRKHRRPFRGVKASMTAAEKAAYKRDYFRRKLADAASGKPLSPGENAAMARIIERIARSPATTSELAAHLEVSQNTAQHYCRFLLLRGSIEVARIVGSSGRLYRIPGSGADVVREKDPERYDSGELAAALGYVVSPLPTGGRVYRIDDDREAA